jgi:hypothetical protein
MRIFKVFLFCLTLSCTVPNSGTALEPDYFVKFKVDGTQYRILFFLNNDAAYKDTVNYYRSDTTVSVRLLEKELDNVIVIGTQASFTFSIPVSSKNKEWRSIFFAVEKTFELRPKAYKIADYDLCSATTVEQRESYEGLGDYSTKDARMFSWQYTWTKNRKPATWIVTDLKEAEKNLRGTFSFAATQADNFPATEGETVCAQRDTYKKITEANITDGEFFLPYILSQ